MKPSGTNTTTKLTMRAAIALVIASAGAAWCLATPSADISSTGPLTHIWLGNDLSCQVQHIADGTVHEFYPQDIFPADAGTFIAINNTLYAPDFDNHDYSSAAFGIGSYLPFTPLSQTMVSGSGTTAADPFKVVTVAGVGTTGLVIQQTDTYLSGREYYTTEITISNNGAGTAEGVLYRAFDAFLGGSDTGYGFTDIFSTFINRKAVGCSTNANNVPAAKIEELIPLTGGNNYFQDFYNTVWGAISLHTAFPDTAASTTLQDNGAGISWNFSIPPAGVATYSHVTTFSPLGLEGLVTSKTADSPTSPAGTQNGYTITIENPNPNAVTVSSITDTLPAEFVYVPGSTTNAASTDPTIAAQMLTWSESFTVPASGSISLHFAVTVATTPGDYFNEAGGSAEENYNVIATGPTAKITVTAGPTPTATATPEATATPTATATFTPTATATATATATPTPTISPTTLTVAPASGTYGGTVNLSATLTSSGSAVSGKTINFTLNGNPVGSATTNSSGVATKTGVSLSGILPGTYPSGVGASFAGDSSYSASSGTASLTVTYGTCIGSDPGGVILPPVNNDGSSVFKRQGGSTIPVKFTVCDANGNPISDPNAVFPNGCCGSITVLTRMRGTVDNVNEIGATDIPDVAFHQVGNHWQFNLVTTNLDAGYTYTFQINLKFGIIQFTVAVK